MKSSLKKKENVHVIDSVEAKWLNDNGLLPTKIEFYRKQKHIEDVFVVLHFDYPPHFAYLHVKESTLVYYDSLKKPKIWQTEVECGCMVVLRYWQLFHNKRYNLKGTKARTQVLKYYNRDHNKVEVDYKNCNEEQTIHLRSRIDSTRKGPSFRLMRSTFMKRI